MSGRKSICHLCGAPRDMGLPYTLCRPCYDARNARLADEYRRKLGTPRKGPVSRQSETYRNDLRRAYARLGLSVGNVWKMVPR